MRDVFEFAFMIIDHFLLGLGISFNKKGTLYGLGDLKYPWDLIFIKNKMKYKIEFD